MELEAAKRVLAQRLDALTAELADKDARLALITAQLHHAKEQLAAKQRCTHRLVLLSHTNGPAQCCEWAAAFRRMGGPQATA